MREIQFRSAHNSLLGTFACRPRRVVLQKCVLESANMVRLLKPLAGCLRDLSLHRTSLGTHETFSLMIHDLGHGGLETLEIKECDVRARLPWSPGLMAYEGFSSGRHGWSLRPRSSRPS